MSAGSPKLPTHKTQNILADSAKAFWMNEWNEVLNNKALLINEGSNDDLGGRMGGWLGFDNCTFLTQRVKKLPLEFVQDIFPYLVCKVGR